MPKSFYWLALGALVVTQTISADTSTCPGSGVNRDQGSYSRQAGTSDHQRDRNQQDNSWNQDRYNEARHNDSRSSDNSSEYRNHSSTEASAHGADGAIINNTQKLLEPGMLSKGYQRVTFDVSGGKVTLKGFVDSESDKRSIMEKVAGFEGVNSIDNQIQVQPAPSEGASLSRARNAEANRFNNRTRNELAMGAAHEITSSDIDGAIMLSIQELLKPGTFSKGYQRVVFDVSGGKVTLQGSVDKESDKRTIMEKVAAIKGVSGIDNQIKVQEMPNPSSYLSRAKKADFQQFNYRTRNELALASTEVSSSNVDGAIMLSIQKLLGPGTFSKGYQRVTFDVSGGKVTLKGSVDKESDKRTIMEKVAAVEGVNSIDNQIKVQEIPNPSSYLSRAEKADFQQFNYRTRNELALSSTEVSSSNVDGAIMLSIQKLLGPGTFSKGYQRVTFDVSGGKVTLKGSVDKESDKRTIMEKVAAVEGVNSIDNQIKVQEIPSTSSYLATDSKPANANPPKETTEKGTYSYLALASTGEVPSSDVDGAIMINVRELIMPGMLSKGYERVTFDVSGGKVTLKGTVDDESDKRALMEKVAAIEGVYSIDNQIKVQPVPNL
jgi:osmotically-inducible protein OsmY